MLLRVQQILQEKVQAIEQALAETKSQQKEEVIRSRADKRVLQQRIWNSLHEHE